MSNQTLIMNCPSCQEEVDFPCHSRSLENGYIYLDELEGNIPDDLKNSVKEAEKNCPRCDYLVVVDVSKGIIAQ